MFSFCLRIMLKPVLLAQVTQSFFQKKLVIILYSIYKGAHWGILKNSDFSPWLIILLISLILSFLLCPELPDASAHVTAVNFF